MQRGVVVKAGLYADASWILFWAMSLGAAFWLCIFVMPPIEERRLVQLQYQSRFTMICTGRLGALSLVGGIG